MNTTKQYDIHLIKYTNTKITSFLAILLLATCLVGTSRAQSGEYAITTELSLPFGLGVAGSYSVIPYQLNVRGQLNTGIKYDRDVNTSGMNVNAEIKFPIAGVYADWFPLNNNFRVSTGLAYSGSIKADATGSRDSTKTITSTSANNQTTLSFDDKSYTVDNGTQYTLNGVTYTINNGVITNNTNSNTINVANDINSATANMTINANIKWKSVAPYIGIGYGNPIQDRRGWGLTFDLGMYYIGTASIDTSVTSNCTNNTTSVSDLCEILVQELNKQKEEAIRDVRDDLDDFKILPNIAIGATYTF